MVRGDSLEGVEALFADEPFQREGLRVNTVRSWQVNEGAMTVSVRLLAGRGGLR